MRDMFRMALRERSPHRDSMLNSATLRITLTDIERVNALVQAEKGSEALPLAKSTQANLDVCLIATFSQPDSVGALPADIVAAMKENDADLLCQFLSEELAFEDGLENIKSLLDIRNNLKRIIISLSA